MWKVGKLYKLKYYFSPFTVYSASMNAYIYICTYVHKYFSEFSSLQGKLQSIIYRMQNRVKPREEKVKVFVYHYIFHLCTLSFFFTAVGTETQIGNPKKAHTFLKSTTMFCTYMYKNKTRFPFNGCHLLPFSYSCAFLKSRQSTPAWMYLCYVPIWIYILNNGILLSRKKVKVTWI